MRLLAKPNDLLTPRVRFRTAQARLERPIASFTFDDFPRSAWTTGGPLLAAYAAKATFFASGGLCGASEDGIDYFERDDLLAATAAGHEIGCHAFTHRRSPGVGSAEWLEDLERNQSFIRSVLGEFQPRSFAYPFGDVSPRTKALASARFPVSRGIWRGVNHGTVDLAQLRVQPLEMRSWTAREVERRVRRAQTTNGWLVFFSHDVAERPSPYGTTPAMLEHALHAVRQAGFDILTLGDAYERLG